MSRMIIKFLLTWCLLLAYMGLVFGFIVEFATTENQSTKIWTGSLIAPLLLVPSLLAAFLTRQKKDRNRSS
jgi:membrane protein DedA with SNARE-associated domain